MHPPTTRVHTRILGWLATTTKALSMVMIGAHICSGCTSKASIGKSVQVYCEVANEMVENGTAFWSEEMVDPSRIYTAWEERSPSKEAQGFLDQFYTELSELVRSRSAEDLRVEDYEQVMAAAARKLGLEPPNCQPFLIKLLNTDRRAASLNFVDQVCSQYRTMMAEQDKTQFGPQQHDDVLRAALAKTTAEARHVNAKGKAVIDALLAVEPPLRGMTFTKDFMKFQKHELEYGDPCFDLQLDVERLYKEHLEKQGIEAP
jgi:hypothetical protein